VVRLSEAQGARLAIGEIFAIRGIGEDKRVGMAQADTPEQVIERVTAVSAMRLTSSRIMDKASRL
jgi:hypothetical protein